MQKTITKGTEQDGEWGAGLGRINYTLLCPFRNTPAFPPRAWSSAAGGHRSFARRLRQYVVSSFCRNVDLAYN